MKIYLLEVIGEISIKNNMTYRKINSKITDVIPTFSVVTLNVNRLNTPTKWRHWKIDKNTCFNCILPKKDSLYI